MKVFRTMLLLVLLLDAMAGPAYAQDQPSATSTAVATQQPSRAQQLMGATAPKLSELTDGVLYAGIWERPLALQAGS